MVRLQTAPTGSVENRGAVANGTYRVLGRQGCGCQRHLPGLWKIGVRLPTAPTGSWEDRGAVANGTYRVCGK